MSNMMLLSLLVGLLYVDYLNAVKSADVPGCSDKIMVNTGGSVEVSGRICNTLLQTNPSNRIKVTVSNIQSENPHALMLLFDGPTCTSSRMITVSEQNLRPFVSSKNEMTIIGSRRNGKSYTLTYEVGSTPETKYDTVNCGGTLTEDQGDIQTNFTGVPLPHLCVWQIKPPSGFRETEVRISYMDNSDPANQLIFFKGIGCDGEVLLQLTTFTGPVYVSSNSGLMTIVSYSTTSISPYDMSYKVVTIPSPASTEQTTAPTTTTTTTDEATTSFRAHKALLKTSLIFHILGYFF